MKLKYLLGIGIIGWMMYSCSEEYMSFRGTDRIQFKTAQDEVYTFTYFPESKKSDTLKISLMCVGEVREYARTIKFEKVMKEWKYIYDEEEPDILVDSIYTDMEYPAVEGLHYELESENNEFILPAHQNELTLQVIVKREDIALRTNAHQLVLRLLPSDDFDTGEVRKLVKRIVISDKLERPTRWKDNSYYYKQYLGNWSEVKQRFMIDVTGQKWDNDFLKYIINSYDTWTLRDYYLSKIKQALADYNADPKNNPPLKDENGKEVVFP